MNPTTTTRRGFVTATAALGLSLKYGCSSETPEQRPAQIYRGWEDLMRNKWTWDRVVRGSRGINCTGHCDIESVETSGLQISHCLRKPARINLHSFILQSNAALTAEHLMNFR